MVFLVPADLLYFVVFVHSVRLNTDSLSGEYVASNHRCLVASRLLSLKLAKQV